MTPLLTGPVNPLGFPDQRGFMGNSKAKSFKNQKLILLTSLITQMTRRCWPLSGLNLEESTEKRLKIE
jgi:hypothetical protein